MRKDRISLMQIVRIIGLAMIVIGVVDFLLGIMLPFKMGFMTRAVAISLNFFILMLGVSFAFPELLQDRNQGLSTMRIVVYMMVNVICMLLLKIGFTQQSLKEIALDANWMGLIAFIFGAKATQSYFERKNGGDKVATEGVGGNDAPTTSFQYTDSELVDLAISQNQIYLLSKSNVRLIIHGKKTDKKGKLIDCVSIHLKDNNHTGIPDKLYVKIPGIADQFVETEIIDNVDKPQVSYCAGDNVANFNTIDYKGNIACKLKLRNSIECLLTCSHVMTGGVPFSMNGFFNNTDDAVINENRDGKWFYGLQNEEFDIALIKDFNENAFAYLDNVKIKGIRAVNEADIKTTKVKMLGRKDFYPANNAIDGYVINNRAILPITITYENGIDFPIKNLIVLSRSINEYKSLSQPGDSGSLILDSDNYAIGMVISQNSLFTYAISMDKIIRNLNAQFIISS